jgi:oligoribonuclease NrnB/cAMP/cGMP phosphodiesterase (DHH superfamily)
MLKHLKNIKKATTIQRKKELWDVEGILHNQKFKFDLRPIKNNCKVGSFKTKADKMVFNFKDQYIIVDVEELHKYLKENNLKDVNLQDLLSKLEWNIILPK